MVPRISRVRGTHFHSEAFHFNHSRTMPNPTCSQTTSQSQDPAVTFPADTGSPNTRWRASYRTQDGLTDFVFSFEYQPNDSWRAYIVRMPDYCDRDRSSHSTHLMNDRGRKYVDWAEPLRTLEMARRAVALWAEATQRYINTGKGF